MRIIKSFFIILLLLLLVFAGCLIVAFKTGIFTDYARDYAVSEIMSITGKNIRIGKIELGFIDNITIKDIAIPVERTSGHGGDFVAIKSIAIRYNLMDYIFRKTEIDKTLSQIIIHSPTVFLKRENGEFNLGKFISTLNFGNKNTNQQTPKHMLPLPINRLFIEDGKIIYEDKDRKFFGTIGNIKGTIFLKDYKRVPDSLYINLNGTTNSGKQNNLAFSYKYSFIKNDYKGALTIDRADMNQWGSYLAPTGGYQVEKGMLTTNLTAGGSSFNPAEMNLSGTLKIEDGVIKFLNGTIISDISSVVFLKNNKVETKSTDFSVFGGTGSIKGEAGDVFKKMEFNATLAFNNIDTEKISSDNFKGGVRGTLSVKGDKEKPEIAGNLIWDSGSLRGMPIKDLESEFNYKSGILNINKIKGYLAEGNGTGNGKIFLKKGAGKSSVAINITGAKIGQVFSRTDFKGALDAGIKIGGSTEDLRIKASISSGAANLSGLNVKNFRGEFSMAKDKITGIVRFDSNKYKGLELKTGILKTKDGFSISDFTLFDKENKMFKATGNYAFAGKKLGIDAGFDKILLSNLDIDYLKDKQLDAALKGGISIRGTTDAPEISFTIDKMPVTVRGEHYKLDAQGAYAENTITLNEFDFGNQLHAKGNFSVNKKLFDMEIGMQNFKGNIINEITKLKFFENSVINGSTVIKKESTGYAGSVLLDAVYQNSVYRKASIDIKGDKDEFAINKIYIKQSGGFLKASGSCSVKNGENIGLLINGTMQDYKINNRLSVKATFSGSADAAFAGNPNLGMLKAGIKDIYFNGKKMADLDVELNNENKDLSTFSLLWGEEYSITGKITGGDSPKINMLARANNADLYPLYSILNLRDKPLDSTSIIKALVKVEGGLDNAAVSLTLSQQEGILKSTGEVSLKKDGIFYKLNRVDLSYDANNLSARDFVYIFDENFDGTGKVNASGTLKGQAENLSGDGEMLLTSGKIFDTPYDSVDIQYAIGNKKITLKKGALNYKNSYLNMGDSSLEIKDKNDYYATLKADMKDFNLQGNRLNGTLNFYGRISNYKNLFIDGSAESDNFVFKNYNFKPFMIKVNYNDDELTAETRKGKGDLKADLKIAKDSIFFKEFVIKDRFGAETVNIKGTLNKSKGDSDLTAEVTNMDPQAANDLLGWGHSWKGTLSGAIKVSGNMQKPAYTIDMKIANGTVDNVDFDICSGLIMFKNDWVDLSPVQNLILSKAGKYELDISGKIPAPVSKEGAEKLKGAPMDVNASLKGGDLSILKFLTWVDDASGVTEAELSIKGTPEFPEVSGKMDVTDGRLKLKYLFGSLEHVYANILIKDNVIDIYNLKGDTKRGTLQIKNLTEGNGGLLKGMQVYSVNWKLNNIGDKAVFSNTPEMEFLEGNADLDLAITGPLEGPDVKGTMKFSDARVTYPPKMSQQKTETSKPGDSIVNKINWDVAVYSGENVYFYNDSTEVNMKTKDKGLYLKGRGDELGITGEIEIVRGTYKYVNTDFTIDSTKESKIIFDGGRIPLMDVYMTTSISGVDMRQTDPNGADIKQPDGTVAYKSTDITVNLHSFGRPGNINIDVSSDPPFEKNRLFYIMTFGRDMDSGSMVKQEDINKAVDAVGNFLVKQPAISNAVKKIVPVDVFGIKLKGLKNFFSGDNTKSGPNAVSNTVLKSSEPTEIELDMGKYFMEKLYVGYNLKLTDSPLLGIQTPSGWNLEQSFSAEYSIDATKKFIISKTFAPGVGFSLMPDYYGIETHLNFPGWGQDKSASRATPTPGK